MTHIPPSGSIPRRPPPAGNDPLPVLATVGAAYRTVFGDGSRVVVRSAAWFGILLLTNLLVSFFVSSSLLIELIGLVVSLAAYVSLAVAWHRAVIVGEVPRTTGETVRFGPREWRFLGISLLAVLIAVGPLILVALSFSERGASSGAYIAAISAAGAYALFMTARLSFAFPLVAIDRSPTPLRTSWQMTRSCWLRLLAAFVLAAIPFAVAGQVLGYVSRGIAGVPALVIILILLSVLSLLQLGVMAALASHAYLHVVGGVRAPPSA